MLSGMKEIWSETVEGTAFPCSNAGVQTRFFIDASAMESSIECVAVIRALRSTAPFRSISTESVTLLHRPFFMTHDAMAGFAPEIIFGSDEKPIDEVAFETGFTGKAFFWAKAALLNKTIRKIEHAVRKITATIKPLARNRFRIFLQKIGYVSQVNNEDYGMQFILFCIILFPVFQMIILILRK